MTSLPNVSVPSREQLLHQLYEAAELEHNLMCTYLYAAFSLREGEAEGLTAEEAAAVARWRRTIIGVAIEEMGHLTAVWNITAALGGSPRFGRGNFPLDPGVLPAGIVVKLAPFGEEVLQHFIHLERPSSSAEVDGKGFAPERLFTRGVQSPRLTPMAVDYATVGEFYATLDASLRAFAEHHGQDAAFCGDPALQLSPAEVTLAGAKPVRCLKTALDAFAAIVQQGEGAAEHSVGSHFHQFVSMRTELRDLKAKRSAFEPAFPAAHNPVLRPPLGMQGRVWIEHEVAAATVDLANTGYALMLRLLAYSYLVPSSSPDKGVVVDLALSLMRAVTYLGERAARLPAGPSNPDCHAGMSFTALRDAAPLPPGPSARRFFSERLQEMALYAAALDRTGDARTASATRIIAELAKRAASAFDTSVKAADEAPAAAPTSPVSHSVAPQPSTDVNATAAGKAEATASDAPPTPTLIDGVEHIEGRSLTLLYDGKKCIHARFCVTGAPGVFLANVKGPWIRPDAVEVDALVEIAHACPSGAIRYRRHDGKHDEAVPAVNLLSIRESGPYAVRGDLRLNGVGGTYRATLCRCGASKNKPYCDGSHHEVGFAATGEPATGAADMLPVRNGPLTVDAQPDGPLQVRGNLEITSGTGRVVARLVQARLCRCGASANKPFCDGSHVRVGFKSS
ncbi:MAG TPA: ferritin-like domain-containing protein [Polyangiaceae bacterium]|nr:ferritin-like domain-containing protein [Polyangiaceae bacterium]